MHKALFLCLLISCGDNIVPPGPDIDDTHPDFDGITVDPGDGPCQDFDHIGSCPDAGLPPLEPDASVPELNEETKGACCHALLDGSPPNHECGYPPGLCKNGKKIMFCKSTDGSDAQFTLCNP